MAADYPDDADGNPLRQLAASRADMSEPIDIDFFVIASDEATAKDVADKAAELGYRTEICFDDEEASIDPWACVCTKSMVPAYPSLIAAQAELDVIARALGAHMDGWGTYGGGEQYTMTGLESESASPKSKLPRYRCSLWPLFVGGLVAVPLLYFGTPHLLAAYRQNAYSHVASFFRLVEPLAIVASTIYVVERFVRRSARWQFSVKELLIGVTAFCLATSVAANQSRYARWLEDAVRAASLKQAFGACCFVYTYYPPYPLLSVKQWFLRLPLLFGVLCLAYVVVKGALWMVRKATCWLRRP